MRLSWRAVLAFAHDVTACAVAWLAAFWLRFNLEIPSYYAVIAGASLIWVVLIHAALFRLFGLYRGIWRYASLPDLQRILAAVGLAAAIVPALLFTIRAGVPRSVFILNPILVAAFMCGSRLAFRAWKERRLNVLSRSRREPVIVLGSCTAAVNLIKDLAVSPQWRVVGVFDNNAKNTGRQMHGVTVLGPLEDLPLWPRLESVSQAIIAMPEASYPERRRALEICRAAGLKVLTVPSFEDLVSGKVTVSQIRHVELDDLLGRDPVTLDASGLTGWLSGKVVMVTGAGGSIGAELCRQIARFEPRLLVMFELNEYALYTIEQEFAQRWPALATVCAIGDVKDTTRVEQVLREDRPVEILHA